MQQNRVGGMTVLRELQQQLPHENFIYFADTKHLPYGNKSPEQIRSYTHEVLTWMKNVAKVKMVVVACNTVSAVTSLPALAAEFSIPIIGTIEPLFETISQIKDARLGIISTPATAASKAHERVFKERGFAGTLVTIGCPDFAPLIEAGLEAGQLNVTLLRARAKEYLQPFDQQQLNTLIYGCTHYPLIKSIIESLLPKTVHFIDPAQAIARKTKQELVQHHLLNKSTVKFECNTDPAVFQKKLQLVENIQNEECVLLQEETWAL